MLIQMPSPRAMTSFMPLCDGRVCSTPSWTSAERKVSNGEDIQPEEESVDLHRSNKAAVQMRSGEILGRTRLNSIEHALGWSTSNDRSSAPRSEMLGLLSISGRRRILIAKSEWLSVSGGGGDEDRRKRPIRNGRGRGVGAGAIDGSWGEQRVSHRR
jgi:hypothetical protein